MTLPPGIRSRFITGVNGLRVHVLEAGFEEAGRPCILLLHGFPELAYSWRKILPALAAEGYHAVAPDQRGYGATTGWDAAYDGDLIPFRLYAIALDALALVSALGYERVEAVVGHDFGSPVAALCALIRPDVFTSVVLMSGPFAGLPKATIETFDTSTAPPDINEYLAALSPPRKHYQRYYSSREANRDMLDAPGGLNNFLRAYFHMKSADWPQNEPFPLSAWTATELAKMPTYYVMDFAATMPQTVASNRPSASDENACAWLTQDELAVYAAEFGRTEFTGALKWYRCRDDVAYSRDLTMFAGKTIDVPACFIAGKQDWGVYQRPHSLEAMQKACTQLRGVHLIDGAGHWVQQEQPAETLHHLRAFLGSLSRQS